MLAKTLRFLIGCIGLTIAAPCAAYILTNGSFETPTVPVGTYINYLAGANLGGWMVVGIDTAIVHGPFTQAGITFQAHDGVQHADLAGVTSNSMASGVTQDVTTTIGATYEISFYVGSAADTDGGTQLFFPATIDLKIDNGPRVSFTNPNAPNDHLDWMQFVYPFIAVNNVTKITFYNGGAPNNYNSSVDDAILSLVGDYNADRKVDAIDYVIWRESLTSSAFGLLADGNRDGTINDLDYDVWRSHFGQTTPGSGSGSEQGHGQFISTVPEPASIVLWMLVSAIAVNRPRWRRS